MNIYLVDDNAAFRETLKFFLEGHLNHKVVGESADGQEFISKGFVPADIILMDINMPNINGLEATKISTWENQQYKIIAVSQYKDNIDLQQLISVGFRGFVSKVNLFDELEDAIITVSNGGFFFPDDVRLTQ